VSEIALWRRLVAELLGSAFLAAVVIGSGIAAVRLSPGDAGLELLQNAAATAAGLFAIILMFGPVSGGHFNPVVSFADAWFGGLRWRDAAAYLPVQVAGCIAGAVAANLMFSRAAVSISARHRASPGHFLSEIIATAGLLLVIFALARTGRARTAPAAVGAYIGAAYFFTSSTGFANPAITVGRMFSDTFAGIAPASAPSFIAAQVIGGVLAAGIIWTLYPGAPQRRRPGGSRPGPAAGYRRPPDRRSGPQAPGHRGRSCPSGPPRTSRAASPGRMPSAATGSSRAAWAPRS
jgi:arsenate reductase